MNRKRPQGFFKRLSVRSMLLALVSIGTFSLAFGLLLTFGLGEIMQNWHEAETKALHQYVNTTLQGLLAEKNATGSEVTQMELTRAFEGLPFAPDYLVITKADGSLLYFYREAQRGAVGAGRARMPLKNFKDIQQWNEVFFSDGSLALRFALHLPAFDEQESNRFLIAASKLLLFWALVTAAVLSLFLAYLFTRPLKKESKSAVKALQSMANGQRNIPLILGGVAEFNDIRVASQVLQDHLVQEEQLRTQWAQDIAHDLRTPISVLRAQLEAMEDGVFKVEKSRLSKLVLETEKLEILVNSLALLTHLETPGFSPKLQDIDLCTFLRSLCEQYVSQAEQKGIILEVDCPKAILRCDPSLLERALGNLLSNAIKHGREAGRVALTVEVGQDNNAIALCLENEGTIGKDVLDHMFDRLYRGEEARSTQGNGLGLSIVKAIVEAHSWKISVSSDKTTKILLSFT